MTAWTKTTAIVGIGQTEFSKNSGRSEMQLAVEASKEAIEDAGLSPSDIDGLVTFTLDRNDEMALCRALSIDHLEWASRTPFGGGGSNLTVRHAAAAVASGAATHVLIYRAFNERSGHRYGRADSSTQHHHLGRGHYRQRRYAALLDHRQRNASLVRPKSCHRARARSATAPTSGSRRSTRPYPSAPMWPVRSRRS